MGFDAIFRNKLSRPSTRPMLSGGGGERSIVWSASDTGLLKRLEALELEVAQLSSRVSTPKYYPPVDLDPDPGVVATTGYELASDGTLRAYVEVTVSGTSLYEVALLAAPEVVYASKDAYVREDEPTTNYGSENNLMAGQPGTDDAHRAWLQFDWGTYPGDLWAVEPAYAVVRLANAGGSVDGVALALAYEDFAGADWDEATVTWNTQEDIGYNLSAVATISGTGTGYTYFDATGLFFMLREAASGSWTGAPYGLAIKADPEDDDVGVYDWISLDGAASDDEKPQLWYWPTAEKAQLMGGSVKAAKLYGIPGGAYYLVHRRVDANNRFGRWSDPVAITLPAVGATPAAPAAAPTIEATNFSNVNRVILTTSVPVDFAAYEVEIYCSAETNYLKTTSDRFEYNFNSGASGRTYKLRYRFVTRSGVTSGWSDYTSTFTVNKELKIQRADASDGTAHILIDADGDTHFVHTSGSSSRTYDYVESQARLLLLDVGRGVGYNNLNSSCGQAANDSEQSTTSTSWVDRTTGSITLTPPGSGNAYYLLIARATLFKDAANGLKLTFKVDGTATSSEEAWSSSAVAETVTIVRRVAVTAGSSHTFKLCFCSNDGGSCKIYRSNIVAIHLGNY